MEWLGENGIPFSIIFTKADKLKGGRLKMNINAYLRELSKQWEELPSSLRIFLGRPHRTY